MNCIIVTDSGDVMRCTVGKVMVEMTCGRQVPTDITLNCNSPAVASYYKWIVWIVDRIYQFISVAELRA